MTKGRKLDWVPKPSKEEIKKIKMDMRLRANDPLPRCHTRNNRRAKELDKELGYVHHMAEGHLCDDCQCKFTSGHGTEHYGYGYCIYHDESIHLKGHALDMAHAQRLAVQQGHPQKVYQYLSGIESIDDIREAAEAAQGRHELKEEIILLKGLLQSLLTQIADRRRNGDNEFSPKEISSISGLTRTIASLAKTELEITDSDYIHVDQMITWFTAVLRAVEEFVEDTQLAFDLKAAIAQIPQPKKGRK
jgi:hypothetical protein